MAAPQHGQAKLDRFAVLRLIDLARFSAAAERDAVAVLRRVAREIAGLLLDQDGPLTTWTRARLGALAEQIALTLATATDEADRRLAEQLHKLAALEAEHAVVEINRAIGAPIATVAISAEQLAAIADPATLSVDIGRRVPLTEWWRQIGAEATELIKREIQDGMVTGTGIEEIARRVWSKPGTPGILDLSKARVRALVRTGVAKVAADVRQQTYDQLGGDGLVKGLVWNAAMESTRTCLVCSVRDLKEWDLQGKPVGHDLARLQIPVHAACRCCWTSKLATWTEIAGRPDVPAGLEPGPSARERFEERLRARGWSEQKIEAAMMNVRSATSGPVPAPRTVEDWLHADHHAAREVLGETRFRLWQSGKFGPLRRFLNDAGDEPLTLDELRERTAQASVAAEAGWS